MNSTETIKSSGQVSSTAPVVVSPSSEIPPEFKTSLVDIDVIAGSSAKFVVQLLNTSNSLNVRERL